VELHRVKRQFSHRDQVVFAHHRCDMRKWTHLLQPDGTFDVDKADPEDDLLCFPIGIYGEGMPRDAAFQAVAVCPACGEAKSAWFVWT
jgi:hypothetical protein